VDVPIVLQRLRNLVPWGPNAQTGSTYAELVSTWPATSGTPPTEAEMLTEWQVYLSEWGGFAPGTPEYKELAARRADAAGLDAPTGAPRVLRAVVSLTVDELNDLRDWISLFKAATASATSLADLKARVAALPNLPARTLQQARTAIVNKVEAGQVDG
jgi:hypothetical protein